MNKIIRQQKKIKIIKKTRWYFFIGRKYYYPDIHHYYQRNHKKIEIPYCNIGITEYEDVLLFCHLSINEYPDLSRPNVNLLDCASKFDSIYMYVIHIMKI